MIKHFKWRLVFDGEKLPVKIDARPRQFDIEETEINYLHGKMWLPTSDRCGSISITLFEPHDLWEGSPNVELHLLSMFGEDIEYWTLEKATVSNNVISYKNIKYESAMSKKEKKKVPPRAVPSRDEYYMGEAFIIASKSKDPRTQVGCRIVSKNNDPLSTGYNGPPQNINDTAIDWDRPEKYPYIVHSEDNAIKRAKKKKLRGATVYVTAPPCKSCMLDIVDAKVARVVYFRPKTDSGSLLANNEEWETTQNIAKLGGVRLDQFQGNLNWLRDRIESLKELGAFE